MKLTSSLVESINISGQGGAEEKLEPLLRANGFERTSMPLYDFINPKTGERVEVKKQAGAQWFDLAKYANMNEQDKDITMLFVMHKSGLIDSIHSIKLGKFLDMLCGDPNHYSNGFHWPTIQKLADLKEQHRGLQTKASVNMRKLVTKEYSNSFKKLY